MAAPSHGHRVSPRREVLMLIALAAVVIVVLLRALA
jgi:hypothetical protein